MHTRSQPQQPARDLTYRGKITQVQGPDRFIVQAGGRDMVFYVNPQTRYLLNGQPGKYADLRVGTEVNTVYITKDDRHYVSSVTVGAVNADPSVKSVAPTTMHGKIVQITAPDRFVIQTPENKQVTFHVGPATRYVIDGKAAKFMDMKLGPDAEVTYTMRDEHALAELVTIGAVVAAAPKEGPVELSGTVVKVVGKDQVVIRTADNKEIIVYVEPQTKYLYDNNQPAQFADVYSGSKVQVQYDLRDRRPVARRVFGFKKR